MYVLAYLCKLGDPWGFEGGDTGSPDAFWYEKISQNPHL